MDIKKPINGFWRDIALVAVAVIISLISYYFGGISVKGRTESINTMLIANKNCDDIQDVRIKTNTDTIAELKTLIKETNTKLDETNKFLNQAIIEMRKR